MRFRFAAILTALAFPGAPFFAQLALAPRSASAGTSVELSVADLVAKSTLVVAGTPVEKKALWQDGEGARGRRIVTFTRVRVDRLIDGAAGTDVWVRTLGGEVDDIGQHVDGEAVLVLAKPLLLFLRAASDGTNAVVGMSQGQFAVEMPENGAPARLVARPMVGRLLEKASPAGVARPSARLTLAGRTLEEAAALIAAERRAQAP